MADPIQTALANEARRQELRASVSKYRGHVDSTANLATVIAQANDDARRQLADAQTQLAALEQGSGPGITDDFGEYSTLEQAMRVERFAGKAACVDYIKANPTCSEADAEAAYRTAALAARPADRQWLLIDPTSLRQDYTANLVQRGLMPDTSWASYAAWVVATDRDVILGMN